MKKFLKRIGCTAEIEYYDRLLYFLVLCTLLVIGLFLVLYALFVPFAPAILVHVIYFILSLSLYILLKYKRFNIVRFCIFIFHLIQLTLAVFVWFPYDTGFNIYYFMVPMSAFIIMRYSNRIQRYFAVIFSFLALILYLLSEILPFDYYMYETSDQINRIFRGISILSILMPMIYIFTMIARRDFIVSNELKELASKDSLTQIYNRRILYKVGNDEFVKARNHSYFFTIVLLDIDFFKNVNDKYGHPVGDVLLKELTELITNNIRKTDIFARYGGEEFAILLGNTNHDEGYAIAEKLLSIIKNHVFVIDGNQMSITVSMGLTQYTHDFDTFDEMMKTADNALYAAKENGRDQIQDSFVLIRAAK